MADGFRKYLKMEWIWPLVWVGLWVLLRVVAMA